VVQYPIGSMYAMYANIWGILMVNVTIYSIHGSYGYGSKWYTATEVLQRQKSLPFVHKAAGNSAAAYSTSDISGYIGAQLQELLSKIVLLVKMEAAAQCCAAVESLGYGTSKHQDCVRAEEILTSTNVDGLGLC